MNDHLKDIFRGKVVNKRLTVNTGVDEFPRYVVEYLIDNYCTEENFDEDFAAGVKRRLRENFVHGAEAEKIRALDPGEPQPHASSPAWKSAWWRPRTSTGAPSAPSTRASSTCPRAWSSSTPCCWRAACGARSQLTYDETEVHNKKIRPFKVMEFTPFQISVIDLDEFIEKRRQFERRRVAGHPGQLLRPQS